MKALTAQVFLIVSIAGFLFSCETAQKSKPDTDPRKIELLFLGHASEHHNSALYMPILAAALSQNGINISYSDKVEDLNPQKLGAYDGLIIYANHEEITGPQEKALLDYVADGHAFIPIHSASFCFQNSPDYINLVGGQFLRHDTATFTSEIIDKNHPAMQSVQAFSTWDETYFHDKLSNDRTVLMERVEGDHREPWTWTKEHGNGKVFYTAYGHDLRTWQNPGFQQLMLQGILWSIDEKVKGLWEEYMKGMPVLSYKDVANIPNYENRDPAPRYQEPLTPEASKKLIQVPVGFQLELFASEPDIINPIAMNWDEKGRLWVIETVDYPNTVRDDEGLGDDRIKICEDTDGDGKADKFTVFAENLNIPTSFTFSNGGIIVSQAPTFLFLKDTNGDDVADVRKTIMEGWGTFDTHAGPSNLQNGIDNYIYGAVGYAGYDGVIFGQQESFKQGLYRFKPNLSEFEFLTNTSNNTWGLGITEDNDIFGSTANNSHSVFMGIPNRILEGVEGIPLSGSMKIDGHYAMHPITDKVRQVDVFGGFTAASGHHFYTARNYPSSFWNKVAFVCEPTGHLVHMAQLEKVGAGFEEKDGWNLMASADEWVSPVEAKVGPDGAVWVLDWYNFIIQHNPTPRSDRGGYDAENGEGNAYINPLRDKSRGRVWRVVSKEGKAYKPIRLDKTKPEELVAAFNNDNMFWRLTAQRLLVENGEKAVLPSLHSLINLNQRDESGKYPSVLHALWTLQGLGVLESDEASMRLVIKSLNHSSPTIRKAAIQILPKTTWVDQSMFAADVLHDADASVRLEALLYFAERTPSEKLGQILYELSQDEFIINDLWLSKAVYATASKHASGFIAAFKKANPGFTPSSESGGPWEVESIDDSNWKNMALPQHIETAGLDIDGVIWFRKTFNIASNDAGEMATLSLGPIDDSDETFINNIKVGGINQSYDKNRVYEIPPKLLKPGKNTVTIRVEDTGSRGGIYGKKEQMFIQVANNKISLVGNWKYAVESLLKKEVGNIFDSEPIESVFVKTYMNKSDINTLNPEDSSETSTVITIKTVKNEMKFDVTEFKVEAGKPVELILENVDFMQHNLLITMPGQMEKVGIAADKLATDPNGAEKNYIPDMPEVLFSTTLVDPEQTVKLNFIAPEKPGVYPFICTFPGHWRIMKGTMIVVADQQMF